MKIKLKRVELGLSQDELANKANVSRATIIKVERFGVKGIRIETLKKIAAALESDIQEML